MKKYFGSNLKMYKTVAETVDYLEELSSQMADLPRDEFEIFIIPSYTSMDRVSHDENIRDILLGAQNMCWEAEGPFTGEISPKMLKELNLDMVMIGHSERRHVFGESDEEENRKVLAGLAWGFTVLLCIGETAEEKAAGQSKEVLCRQLREGFKGVQPEQIGKIWVAYEPVWSIGESGTPASPEYAEEMHKEIKTCLFELFGEAGAAIPTLYGGSVNPGNAKALFARPSVDGLFVGRSAWQAKAFRELVRIALSDGERVDS